MFEKHTISYIFHKREINNRNTPIRLHDMTFIIGFCLRFGSEIVYKIILQLKIINKLIKITNLKNSIWVQITNLLD